MTKLFCKNSSNLYFENKQSMTSILLVGNVILVLYRFDLLFLFVTMNKPKVVHKHHFFTELTTQVHWPREGDELYYSKYNASINLFNICVWSLHNRYNSTCFRYRWKWNNPKDRIDSSKPANITTQFIKHSTKQKDLFRKWGGFPFKKMKHRIFQFFPASFLIFVEILACYLKWHFLECTYILFPLAQWLSPKQIVSKKWPTLLRLCFIVNSALPKGGPAVTKQYDTTLQDGKSSLP